MLELQKLQMLQGEKRTKPAVVAGASIRVVGRGAQMHRVHPASPRTTRVRLEPTGQEMGQVGGGHVDWGGCVTAGIVTVLHTHRTHEPTRTFVTPFGHAVGHTTGEHGVCVGASVLCAMHTHRRQVSPPEDDAPETVVGTLPAGHAMGHISGGHTFVAGTTVGLVGAVTMQENDKGPKV
jgi:hypothetical protein